MVDFYCDSNLKRRFLKYKPKGDNVSIDEYMLAYYTSFLKSANRPFSTLRNIIEFKINALYEVKVRIGFSHPVALLFSNYDYNITI